MPDLKDELIEKLSHKYHLSKAEVAEVVNYQFRFTARVIKQGEFNAVRLPYFGIFKPNLKHKKHLDGKHEHDRIENT